MLAAFFFQMAVVGTRLTEEQVHCWHSYAVRAISKEAQSQVLGFEGPCNTQSFKDGPTICSGDLVSIDNYGIIIPDLTYVLLNSPPLQNALVSGKSEKLPSKTCPGVTRWLDKSSHQLCKDQHLPLLSPTDGLCHFGYKRNEGSATEIPSAVSETCSA